MDDRLEILKNPRELLFAPDEERGKEESNLFTLLPTELQVLIGLYCPLPSYGSLSLICPVLRREDIRLLYLESWWRKIPGASTHVRL